MSDLEEYDRRITDEWLARNKPTICPPKTFTAETIDPIPLKTQRSREFERLTARRRMAKAIGKVAPAGDEPRARAAVEPTASARPGKRKASRARKPRPEREARMARVLAEAAQGMTGAEIARVLEIPQSTVASDVAALRRAGRLPPAARWDSPRPGASPDDAFVVRAARRARVLELADGVRSMAEIAQSIGATLHAVKNDVMTLRKAGKRVPMPPRGHALNGGRRAGVKVSEGGE